LSDHSSNAPFGQNEDPFGEDFFVLPYGEEIKERARIVLEHNQDALRHFVEVLAWETFDHPELRRHLVPVLWLLVDIDRRWIAEALCMNVHDVCALVEGNPIMAFNCLNCGVELQPEDRHHLSTMSNSVKAICEGAVVDKDHLSNLLCGICVEDRTQREDEQRRLDQARLQALLAEYRKRPYADRRRTTEWLVLKRRVFRRDGYRCKLCGRNDLPLHLHHCTYENYASERLEDLITLCERCHERHHCLEGTA
jgi:5-methylcytosine-specific restriction endonuclease McrA